LSIPDKDNRRLTPRQRVRQEICLQVNLSILDSRANAFSAHETPLTIFGNTHDLSASGVAFVVPFISVDEKFCQQAENTLPLLLYLPTGEVKMQVAPVRCIPLDKRDLGKGFFIGAKIAGINNGERARFHQYLNTIAKP
jgi:hypothetical protein